jgi:hypothetical protein
MRLCSGKCTGNYVTAGAIQYRGPRDLVQKNVTEMTSLLEQFSIEPCGCVQENVPEITSLLEQFNIEAHVTLFRKM